ncbi:MAG TPA: phosphoglycerate mutase family protein [Steroidobacteraceae bacterium]|jgi:broad specificity phosphatase PhoE
MEAPVITRSRRPFLLPVWLTFAAAAAFVVILLLVYFLTYHSATTTMVVLALHAEPESGTIQDPPLSTEGEQRAARLAQMFGRGQGAGRLAAIYVSDARRAQQTAAPLAERLGKQPVVVPAADIKGTAARILHDHEGDTVLVIGHSKSVPALIHELADITVAPLASDEYDTLYVVSIPSFGHANVLRMQY